MKQIFIDVTTKNCMFTSIESQGSFLFHRFGKRDITEEHLNITKLLEYINKTNPDQIILESVFGDPLEYKHIKKLCIFCKENNIQVICVTNGFSDNFNLLDSLDVYYLFKLYAFTDTAHLFYPENDFNKLLSNLKYCNKLQYNVYKENLKDVNNVYEYSDKIEVEFVHGPLVHVNINHIITQNGKWLYDIYGLQEFNINDYTYKTLSGLPNDFTPEQTMVGYHLLKNYVKPPLGESIESANVYKIDYNNDFPSQTSISVKGHIFDSIEDRNIITNTYLNDWTIEDFDSNNQYQKSILAILSNFAYGEKESI